MDQHAMHGPVDRVFRRLPRVDRDNFEAERIPRVGHKVRHVHDIALPMSALISMQAGDAMAPPSLGRSGSIGVYPKFTVRSIDLVNSSSEPRGWSESGRKALVRKKEERAVRPN